MIGVILSVLYFIGVAAAYWVERRRGRPSAYYEDLRRGGKDGRE